ncbi:hypothetical protein CB0940_05305 [Cercospora beticola]|uniref:Apple domain-containing protein n=1 Tax=Cercospora beticola TaxID=122368 RepID=A0A2G5HX69_CERBT|nr:hypothetical protein CB0940_05305 [Cercospora beticola]PIA97147.1 hypothetical protein CB0940_05305 [Cercospora beticola]WPA97840.1 hypothetical protein RHO25_002451 [Cercospora beticola]CAK1359037.1 unnamed protein product [Cercospora beticola]
MHNDGSHAPEVVPGSGADGLIPAPDRAVEAPQSLHENTSPAYSYPPGHKDDQAYSSAYGTQDEKLANVTAAESGLAQARPNKRKRLIWIVIGAILLALAIGLGVGLGVGLSQNSNDEDQNAETGDSQEATQTDLPTTTITPTSATSTPTSSAVTSGSTGLAQFSCNSTETTTSESGTPYIQECYTQYQVNRPSFYNPSNTTLSNLGGKLTVYTFQDCLDKCDERNEAGTNPPCRAVTYYANLTKPIQLWGGNCFLKNDRGNGFQTDPVDWGHTASAYMSCLNETCWGENV